MAYNGTSRHRPAMAGILEMVGYLMKVVLVGMTSLVQEPGSYSALETHTPYSRHEDYVSDVDELHEFSGRACYQSWKRPNPATSTNSGYLGHIDEVKHFSILGHGYVNFYVTGVSRSLLQELVRHSMHMNIALSVLSQRYVDHSRNSDIGFVPPPLFDDYLTKVLDEHHNLSRKRYEQAVQHLVDQGYNRKEARGAARAFLPESTETRFMVSGHIRAFRDIITKRDSTAADAEIREFAQKIKIILKEVAPNSMTGID